MILERGRLRWISPLVIANILVYSGVIVSGYLHSDFVPFLTVLASAWAKLETPLIPSQNVVCIFT